MIGSTLKFKLMLLRCILVVHYIFSANLHEFGTGIYIVHSDHSPSFEIQFFPPTNKFAAGGASL